MVDLRVVQGAVTQRLGKALDREDGRLKFMRDIAEEFLPVVVRPVQLAHPCPDLRRGLESLPAQFIEFIIAGTLIGLELVEVSAADAVDLPARGGYSRCERKLHHAERGEEGDARRHAHERQRNPRYEYRKRSTGEERDARCDRGRSYADPSEHPQQYHPPSVMRQSYSRHPSRCRY